MIKKLSYLILIKKISGSKQEIDNYLEKMQYMEFDFFDIYDLNNEKQFCWLKSYEKINMAENVMFLLSPEADRQIYKLIGHAISRNKIIKICILGNKNNYKKIINEFSGFKKIKVFFFRK